MRVIEEINNGRLLATLTLRCGGRLSAADVFAGLDAIVVTTIFIMLGKKAQL